MAKLRTSKPKPSVKPSTEKPLPSITEGTQGLCDPCQILVADKPGQKKHICGWQGPSLQPHLSSHRYKNGRIYLTVQGYREKFPHFSTGKPSYIPSEEAISRMLEKNPNLQAATQKKIENIVAPELAEVEKEVALNNRFEELWSMCERDPAARVFCRHAAQDEALLDDARARAEKASKMKRWNDLKLINVEIKEVTIRYTATFQALNLTVKQRRETNQLGNDAPSQLISNYGNTLRKWNLDKQEAFERRIESIKAGLGERIRVAILDEVDDSFDKKRDDSAINYREAIAAISKRNRTS